VDCCEDKLKLVRSFADSFAKMDATFGDKAGGQRGSPVLTPLLRNNYLAGR